MPSDATSVTSNVSQRDNVLLILEFFFNLFMASGFMFQSIQLILSNSFSIVEFTIYTAQLPRTSFFLYAAYMLNPLSVTNT